MLNGDAVSSRPGECRSRKKKDLQEADASARVHQLFNDLGAPFLKVVQRNARHGALIVRLEGRHVALCLDTR